MKYIVEETDAVFYEINEVIDYCISGDYHDEDDDSFEEYVNDNYEDVEIYGRTFYPYEILAEMDEDRLNDLRQDYCEYMNQCDRDNAWEELEHAAVDDVVYIQGYTVKVQEEEKEIDDDNTIEALRIRLAAQKEEFKQSKAQEENDLKELIQVIGA